ncbi:hypothetical protein CAC01_24620 [Streptomyces sp. CLI2509]|nr:hypothetical protein CAC01_24620 [Streptomyces sp. CLI2509]
MRRGPPEPCAAAEFYAARPHPSRTAPPRPPGRRGPCASPPPAPCLSSCRPLPPRCARGAG